MARMKTSRKWLDIVRRKFFLGSSRTKNRNIIVLHSNACSSQDQVETSGITAETADIEKLTGEISSSLRIELTQEDIAAIKIQTVFRAHLAQRAFRALRSLVKLQALVRGAYVRRQTRIALHCMQALLRLQIRVRARQLLGRNIDD